MSRTKHSRRRLVIARAEIPPTRSGGHPSYRLTLDCGHQVERGAGQHGATLKSIYCNPCAWAWASP